MQRSYQFDQELVSYRLDQVYYVSRMTLRDFRNYNKLKYQLDVQVESDRMKMLERSCNSAKSKRQLYIKESKIHAGVPDPNATEIYLQRAE